MNIRIDLREAMICVGQWAAIIGLMIILVIVACISGAAFLGAIQ